MLVLRIRIKDLVTCCKCTQSTQAIHVTYCITYCDITLCIMLQSKHYWSTAVTAKLKVTFSHNDLSKKPNNDFKPQMHTSYQTIISKLSIHPSVIGRPIDFHPVREGIRAAFLFRAGVYFQQMIIDFSWLSVKFDCNSCVTCARRCELDCTSLCILSYAGRWDRPLLLCT